MIFTKAQLKHVLKAERELYLPKGCRLQRIAEAEN